MPDPWFPFVQTPPRVEFRLFCLPFAGGGASAYRRWAEALPESVELRAVQLPGRETRVREVPLRGMRAMVGAVMGAIEPLLDRPYALFGHSLGGLLAFELCRELRRRAHVPPNRLFASAIAAPHVRSPLAVYDLPDPAFKEELKRLNGTPDAVLQNEELMRLFLPMLRADFETSDRYVCADDAPLDVPITVLGGRSDDVTRAELDAWGEQSTRGASVHLVSGGHFFLESAFDDVIEIVSQGLDDGTGD